MKKTLIIVLALAFGFSALSQTVEEALGAQRYLEKYIPGFVRAKFDEYLKMIGIKNIDAAGIGGSNRGLINYNENIISQNTCFKELDSIFHRQESTKADSLGRIENNLSTSTENSKIESGWQWDIAMRVANNDPNLAIMLIGQCGHDNDAIERPECTSGRDSPRYTQGSLGEETILPQNFREEIAQIQSPNMGLTALPSKYYHTIGAAYTACSLVREGVPGFLIRRVQTAAANTYRMMNLCNNDSNMVTRGKYLERILKSGLSIDDLINFYKSEDIQDRMSEMRSNGTVDLVEAYSQLYEHFVTYGYLEAERDILKEKLLTYQSFTDANKLFQSQVVRNDDCMSPQITKSRINKMKRAGMSKTGCTGISRARCMVARNRLLTWWADFEWTEAQHLKGVEFAINNCRKEPNFMKNLKGKACDAVKQYRATEESNRPRQEVSP